MRTSGWRQKGFISFAECDVSLQSYALMPVAGDAERPNLDLRHSGDRRRANASRAFAFCPLTQINDDAARSLRRPSAGVASIGESTSNVRSGAAESVAVLGNFVRRRV